MDSNLQAWKKELARLRADIAAASRALAAGKLPETRTWHEPKLGKMPASLRLEAEQIQLELENLNALINSELEKNRAQRDRLHPTPKPEHGPRPVYLDVQG